MHQSFSGMARSLAVLFWSFLLVCNVSAAPTQHIYDEAGRVVETVVPDGRSVRYIFDANNNLNAIRTVASNTLSIAEFTPNSGVAGTVVNLYGSGFNLTPASNLVKFNGVAAVVSAATNTRLTVTAPSGVTTGLLSVTTSAGTVLSNQAFTVAATPLAPTFTAFTPTIGAPGSTITLTGSGFDTDRYNNTVTLNGMAMPVTSANATQLIVQVPRGATSGRLRVSTLYGSATAPGDFFVPPPGLAVTDIAVKTRLQADQAATSFNLPAGKTALLLVDGSVDQRLGMAQRLTAAVPADGIATGARVLRPNGELLTVCSASLQLPSPHTADCDWPRLSDTGVYTVVVAADATHALSHTFTLSNDLTGTLTHGAAALAMPVNRTGQNVRLNFQANQGNALSLFVEKTQFGTDGAVLSVLAPSGVEVANGNVSESYPNATLDLTNLPETGLYTLFIDPQAAAASSLEAGLRTQAQVNIAVDGAALDLALLNSQNASVSFNGTAGQLLGLGAVLISPNPADRAIDVKLIGPNGVALPDYCQLLKPAGNCYFAPLPTSGTYRLQFDPAQNASATLRLTLSNALAGTLPKAPEAPALITVARQGQPVNYRYSGTAGQGINVAWSAAVPAGNLQVLDPLGQPLQSAVLNASSNAAGVLRLPRLLVTGDYTVRFQPYAGETGTLRLQAIADTSVALTADAAPIAVQLLAGQHGRYTFSATAGQVLGIGINGLTIAGAPNDNLELHLETPVSPSQLACAFSAPGGACKIGPLPATGTYTLRIGSSLNAAPQFNLALSKTLSAALPPDTAVQATLSRTGQPLEYSFTAQSGQAFNLIASQADFTQNVALTLMAPDGSTLLQSNVSRDQPIALLDVASAPVTGNYRLSLFSASNATGKVILQFKTSLNGTLVPDAAATRITLAAGQKSRHTFTGALGQRLSLALTGLSTTPADGTWRWVIDSPYQPDWFECGQVSSSNPASQVCAPPALPAAGTYTMRLQPQSPASFTAEAWVSNNITGALALNAAALPHRPTRVAQGGAYGFDASAGESYRLDFSGTTFGAVALRLTDAQGALVNQFQTLAGNSSGFSPTGALNLTDLPRTGRYFIEVAPLRPTLGEISLRLTRTVTTVNPTPVSDGPIALDGAARAFSLTAARPRQSFTFTGTVGQRLGFALHGLNPSTDPGIRYQLLLPNGRDQLLCETTQSIVIYSPAGGCLFNVLPATGTYTLQLWVPDGTSATGNATLSSVAIGTLAVDAAAAVPITLNRIGQTARYSFTATAGQAYTLAWSNTTFGIDYGRLRIVDPDGQERLPAYFGGPDVAGGQVVAGTFDLTDLTRSGSYAVSVEPATGATGRIDLRVLSNLTAPIAVDGATVAVALKAGQNARYTFAATAGQSISLGLDQGVVAGELQSLALSLYDPQGQRMNCNGPVSFTQAACQWLTLPITGTYTIALDTQGTGNFNARLTLSKMIANPIAANASTAITAAPTRLAQDARYTFDGLAGERYSMLWSGNTLPDAELVMLDPAANTLGYPYRLNNAELRSGASDSVVLPVSGTYSVLLDNQSAATGQAAINLRRDAASVLTLDSTPLDTSLSAGQNGNYTIRLNADQSLGIGISRLTTTPATQSVSGTLVGPDGDSQAYCGTGFSPADQIAFSCKLDAITQTGDYQLRLDPVAAAAAAFTLTASSDIKVPLTLNAATVRFSTTRAGQNGRYTFSAVAGRSYTLLWRNASVAGSESYISVRDPAGQTIDRQSIGNPSLGNTSGLMALPNLNATGPYTVLIQPLSLYNGAASIDLTVAEQKIVPITVDASPLSLVLSDGQEAALQFNGIAGQNLAAVLTDINAAPNNEALTVELYSPQNQSLKRCTIADTYNPALPNGSCQFPRLTTSGVYTLRILSRNVANRVTVNVRTLLSY